MSGLTDDRELDRQDTYRPASYGGDLFNRLPPEDEDEHDLRGYEPVQPKGGLDVRGIGRKLAAPFVALAALVWKLKVAVFALFKLKLFATAGTMIVSIGAYALLWPWQFAIGFVLLLLVHELGHVIEARRQGLPTSAPMFVPFLGALITMKEMPKDAWNEAKVALAGPVLGSIGAAVVWVAGVALDSDLLRALAFFGFLINLFNLLPVHPLDGGRATEALHPVVWLIGLAGLVALTIISPNPVLILILLFGGLSTWERWQNRHHPERQAFSRITGRQRLIVAVVYLGLAVALGIAADLSHLQRDM
jgi:Zn-dependent protease